VQEQSAGFDGVSAGALLDGWQAVSQLCGRGEALNLDRAQMIEAMAFDLRNALREKAA